MNLCLFDASNDNTTHMVVRNYLSSVCAVRDVKWTQKGPDLRGLRHQDFQLLIFQLLIFGLLFQLFSQHHNLLVVPGAGLEPAHLAARDFESLASTNFATRAGC